MKELRKLLLDFLGERIANFGFNAKPKQGSGLLLSHLMFMLFLMFEKYDNKRPDPICRPHMCADPICAYFCKNTRFMVSVLASLFQFNSIYFCLLVRSLSTKNCLSIVSGLPRNSKLSDDAPNEITDC